MMGTQRVGGGVWERAVSHFVCPGKVRGKVEGMTESGIADCIVPSWIWINDVIFSGSAMDFFWINHGIFPGSITKFFLDLPLIFSGLTMNFFF